MFRLRTSPCLPCADPAVVNECQPGMIFFTVRLPCAAFFILLVVLRSTCLWAEATIDSKTDYSWQAPLASQSLLISLDGTGDTIQVAGSRGHILRRSNSGIWHQSRVQASVLLTAIRMFDSSTGLAVGHDGIIVRTDDGGHTWTRVHEDKDQSRPLLDIVYLDSRKIIAVGAYGYYLISNDSGHNWQEGFVNENHDFHLNAISHHLHDTIYIVGEAGHIYRSRDRGLTWDTLSSPYEGSWFDVLVWEGSHVAIAGLRGRLYYSKNKGESWLRIPTSVETSFNSLIRLRNGQLMAVGHAGSIIIVDKNYQQSFLHQLKGRDNIADAYEYKSNHVVLAGENGVRYLDLCDSFSPAELKGCIPE